ncbi:MAG: sugar nucleotide-binding protein [Patescibacteria group bacterium]
MKKKSKDKNILITGGSGFIGSNFLSYALGQDNSNSKNDLNLKKLQYRIIAPSHGELDILNINQLRNMFKDLSPEIVINFAAHRDANSAELQRGNINGPVWKTNVKGVGNISKVCQEYGSFFIHISTDMVFSGNRDNHGPYDEKTKPEMRLENLSWYGWTKAEGERVLASNKKTAIIRVGNVTNILYDPKLDYVGKILFLFDHGKLYPLFNNQYLTLTYIPSIFEVIEVLIESKIDGIFHVASKNVFTPYGLGEYLIKKIRNKTGVIRSISINDYLKKSPNRYPKYGGLLAEKTGQQLQVKLFDWEQIVDFYVDKMESSFHE